MAAYTTIDDPSAYFQTVLYTGNATGRSITNTGNSDLQPDWIWIKSRSTTHQPVLTDSVRGTGKELRSDTSDAESSLGNITAFNSDGFSIGTRGEVNNSGSNFVAWQWKAGTSFTNDTSATSIGTIDSTGSVNETAGFSICSYTGTGSNGTIKHGLSTVPHMIIQKNLTSGTHAWNVYHKNLTSAGYNLNLDGNYAEFTSATTWNSTAPTSSVFSVGTDTNANESGSGHIAYCFAEKKGYSKFGSYTGNSNADGTFIYTGFRPAFFMWKRTDTTTSWGMIDNKRDTINVMGKQLFPNSNSAEASYTVFDFCSNGIKMRNTFSDTNVGSYIYMAFAENPFVTSTGVPACAR